MNQWGFYYLPKGCETGGCPVALMLAGSGGGSEEGLIHWAPIASANKLVIVAPQTYVSWDEYPLYPDGSGGMNFYTGDLALTKKGH